MTYRYLPYCWPLWISAFITLSLGLFTMVKRRSAKGAVSFSLSMMIVTVWSAGNALEILGADFATKLFWANVQYFAYCYSPVTLLILCMEYTGFDRWVRNRKVLWLCVVPTIVFFLVWTDGSFGLVRSGMHLNSSGLFPVIAKEYGPVFYLHTTYSYLLNFFAWALLFNAAFFKHSIYRKQAFSLLFGLSLIMASNFAFIAGLFPKYRFDLTPLLFGPAGLVAAWGLFRYRLFEIVPMAWATVLRIMDPGVMIMDSQARVLDVNPAFERIFGVRASQIVAKPFDEICGRFPEFANMSDSSGIKQREFCVCEEKVRKTYESIFSPLLSDDGVSIGRFAMIYDATEKKAAQELLFKQQWQLAASEEREKTARDLHDSLGQVLGFINLQAQGIRQELKNAGVDLVTPRLDRLVDATQSAHSELREYIRGIRDPAYSETDFPAALHKNIAEFEGQTGLSVKLNITDEFQGGPIRPDIGIQALGIVREALNNIRKHAEAKHVEITVSLPAGNLHVSVSDDGIGFQSCGGHEKAETKFGLAIMRERAAEAGGMLKIESSPGKGCRIALDVPAAKGGDLT